MVAIVEILVSVIKVLSWLCSYLTRWRDTLGQRVNPGAVFSEFLLILQRCHLKLVMNSRQLSQKWFLSFSRFQSLFLQLLIQADNFPLQRAVVRFEGFQTAVVVQLLLFMSEHQSASTLAYPDRSVITRFTHVSIHIFKVQHLAAALIPTFGRGIIAHLRVLRQMLKFDDLLAAPRVIVTFNI